MLDTLQVQGDQSDVSRLCSCAETELARKPRICASPTGEMSVSLYFFTHIATLFALETNQLSKYKTGVPWRVGTESR